MLVILARGTIVPPAVANVLSAHSPWPDLSTAGPARKGQRFYPTYPGFDVDVLDGSGSPAASNPLLYTVPDSYPE